MNDGQRALGSDSAPGNPPAPRLRRWERIIDGGRVWGSIDIWPNKCGFSRYRLVVFPPGIDRTERRYVRLARSWPTWGAALWLLLAIALGGNNAGWVTVLYPTAAFLLTGAIIFGLARDAHANTRTLSAALLAGHQDPAAAAQFERLDGLTRALVTADAMRARDELTIVEHEAIWWTVYDALGQEGPALV